MIKNEQLHDMNPELIYESLKRLVIRQNNGFDS